MTYNERLGQKIVELFELPKLRIQSKTYGKPYYYTAWGNKNIEGIGASIRNIINEIDVIDLKD